MSQESISSFDYQYRRMRDNYIAALDRIDELEREVFSLKSALMQKKERQITKGKRKNVYDKLFSKKLWENHYYKRKGYAQLKAQFNLKICVATIRKIIVQYTIDYYLPFALAGGFTKDIFMVYKEEKLIKKMIEKRHVYGLSDQDIAKLKSTLSGMALFSREEAERNWQKNMRIA